MIQFQNITLRRGSQTLLEEASASIFAGQRVGLVGVNGAGKSSLFSVLQSKLQLEDGEVIASPKLKYAYSEQETPEGDWLAIDYVMTGDAEWHELDKKLEVAEADNDGMAIANLHAQLADIDGYRTKSRAAKILLGLGFTQRELELSLEHFSGGWKMRLSLAKVLMSRADIFLLDEPTNHLDLEAILWLQTWLAEAPQTMVIISHDREFLDHVVTHTIHLHDKKLAAYTGNYSAFEKLRAEQLALQQAAFEKQAKAKAHMEDFIRRFSAKASKAKQAQSRVKMLSKMDNVMAVRAERPFEFSFKTPPKVGNPMLRMRGVHVGYEDGDVLQQIAFSLESGDRIGLIGPNGAGKSTFIKLLAQMLAPSQGEFVANSKLQVGYFAQHHLDRMDVEESAIQNLMAFDASISESVAKNFLFGFNFTNHQLQRPMNQLSGGQQARLVLAMIIWQSPNLLLLDEPTNHLDLGMREALSLALQAYEGAMVLVSHDRFLLDSSVDQLWLVAEGEVKPFSGTVDDYYLWLKENYW